MTKRTQRTQKSELVVDEDTRPLVVRPLEGLTDRRRNPKDIEVDTAAIAHGVTHGGMQVSRAGSLVSRGSGGRGRSGRDVSKRR